MKTLISKITLLILTCVVSSNYAQQDAQYTQYMYNTISVNPAYAGSRGVLSVMGLHRSQWVGLDGAPRTQTLTVNTPLGENERLGIGFSVVNDEIGPTDETFIGIDFSYTIQTSEIGKLSFGIKGGGHLLNIDFQRLTQFNTNDNLFETNIDNKFSPQVGIGVYYHTDAFYAGLSAPNLLETDHFDESTTSSDSDAVSFLAEERINYYLIVGHVFDLNEEVKFKPAILSKLVFGAPLQVDVSANFLLYDRFTLGAAYRWSAAVSGQVAFQVSDAMMIGFAYEYNRMLTPRFF